MTLLAHIAAHLEAAAVRFCVVGAAAMAVHGVSRSTFDIDLLTLDPRVLEPTFWERLGSTATIDVRVGDDDDPLAGVVRLTRSNARDVDVIVGRGQWQQDILEAAALADIEGTRVPVADGVGLILLKLYAGGSQDAWDVTQLLAAGDRDRLIRAVDVAVSRLPESSRTLWTELKTR